MSQINTYNKRPIPIEAYVNKYIRFDPPSSLPSVMCSWSDTVSTAVKTAMNIGCKVEHVTIPVEGTHIIGNTAQMQIRDHLSPPVKGIGLQDQYCIFDLENELQAFKFMDCILQKIEYLGHEVEYINSKYSSKFRHFVVRTKDGYKLYTTSCVTPKNDQVNKNAVQLFIHWKIDFHAPTRKRKSDNTAQNSNVFDRSTSA